MEEYGQWNENDWERLIRNICRQECILMLGPDASLEDVAGQSRPLHEILAKELAAKIPAPQDIQSWKIDPSNLAQIAQYYKLKGEEDELLITVENFYDARENMTTPLYRNLAVLPFYLTISSTPDNLFYHALRETRLPDTQTGHKKPLRAIYNYSGGSREPIRYTGTPEEPLIYHLYGHVDDSDSLVLSENDFLNFLVAVLGKYPISNAILKHFQHKNTSMLFLGFDFRAWHLQTLLHILLRENKEKTNRPSFALEKFTTEDEFKRLIFFYKEDYNIRICDKNIQSFARELRENYEKFRSKHEKHLNNSFSPPKRHEITVKKAPIVFICHAKADREKAQQLFDRFQAADFEPWFDEEDLQAGDTWERKIERTIGKIIDYFVVVQSHVMSGKPESFFHKEIRLALKREERFGEGFCFVIPIRIEECDLLENLKHIQTKDVFDEDGINTVIRHIKEDYQKRGNRVISA